MSKTIRVSDKVYESLKEVADPLRDTPDAVIRRMIRALKDHDLWDAHILGPIPSGRGDDPEHWPT